MVHTNIPKSTIRAPYQDVRKGKTGPTMCENQQNSPKKGDKYNSWGPIFKNKQNFIDMHTC